LSLDENKSFWFNVRIICYKNKSFTGYFRKALFYFYRNKKDEKTI